MVENTRFACSIRLERLDSAIRFSSELRVVVIFGHQFVSLVARYLDPTSGPVIKYLLTEIKRPVKRWAVVVDQLRIGDDLSNAVDHRSNLPYVRLFSLNPQQISAILKRCNAIKNHSVFTSAWLEAE